MRLDLRSTVLACLALFSAAACGVDTAPDGARRTPPGTGLEALFDLTRRRLPEIPQPDDVATFADPTSRTGRRINLDSPTLPVPLEMGKGALPTSAYRPELDTDLDGVHGGALARDRRQGPPRAELPRFAPLLRARGVPLLPMSRWVA